MGRQSLSNQILQINIVIGGSLGRDALVVTAPGDMTQTLGGDFIDDRALGGGGLEQTQKAGVIAQLRNQPDPV